MLGSNDEPRHRLAARLLPAAASVGLLTACAFDFGGVIYDDATSATSTSPGSTSTGPGGEGGAAATSTGAGAEGGGGSGPIACGDVECPVVECYATTCEGETCLLTPLAEGAACGPEGAQTCTASLDCVACAEAEDCAPPLSSCRTVACVEGACVESVVPERGACVGEVGVCDAAQACVECVDEQECTDGGQVCVDGACTTPAATCSDGAQNAGETAVDCGGPCPPCANGLTCAGAVDCQSGYCNGVCSACANTAQCGATSWCDGGTCAARKGNGVTCWSGVECTSASCVDGVCCDDGCLDTCMSCRASATGRSDGTCAPSLVGTDPDFECLADTCQSGSCDGAGHCGWVAGECPDLCQDGMSGSFLFEGTCSMGTCVHDVGYSCGLNMACNATLDACEPK